MWLVEMVYFLIEQPVHDRHTALMQFISLLLYHMECLQSLVSRLQVVHCTVVLISSRGITKFCIRGQFHPDAEDLEFDLDSTCNASKWMHWVTLRCHSDLLSAATSASSQVIPILNKSLLTVLLQFVSQMVAED